MTGEGVSKEEFRALRTLLRDAASRLLVRIRAMGSDSGMAGTDPRITSGPATTSERRHGNQPVSVPTECSGGDGAHQQRRERAWNPSPSAERRKRHGALLPTCNEKAPA
jgi:hypothetical protein